jgi:membrane-bound lytic murein transglycosylase MltF
MLAALAIRNHAGVRRRVARGAQGVMMLMPLTATKMGVKDVFSADENIMAGAATWLI